MDIEKCDALIVGTGIAGLSFALYLAESDHNLEIILLSKGDLDETNTWLAQGGIAAVMDHSNDTFENHIKDTLECGRGLCDEQVVRQVVYEAPERIKDLIRWGVSFDQGEHGFDLHQEGGHSARRIFHHKDFTGKEVHSKLLRRVQQQPNIQILTHTFGIDLLVHHVKCFGLDYYCSQQARYGRILSKATMLATGGCGQLFPLTTNSSGATGDGLAMAARAGALTKDMRFYQFHPTALYTPSKQFTRPMNANTVLISEAVRGYGAHLIDESGNRFLFDYDSRGELATRDVVTHAIFDKLKQTSTNCVFLSVKHLDQEELAIHFPTIWKQCIKVGLDLTQEGIPVLPAAHYQCGGIRVNKLGQTSIERLFAGGECACTGLHGANRLASNSLLEALVFAYRSAQCLFQKLPYQNLIVSKDSTKITSGKSFSNQHQEKNLQIRDQLTQEVSNAYFQKNNLKVLENSLNQIYTWRYSINSFPLCNVNDYEARNLLDCAAIMIHDLILNMNLEHESKKTKAARSRMMTSSQDQTISTSKNSNFKRLRAEVADNS